MKNKIKGKVCTWDDKPAYEDEASVEIKTHHTNKAKLCLHTEIATGEHQGKTFRFIMAFNGAGFMLQYDKRTLVIDTAEMVTALMNKMRNLNALKDGKMTKKKG